MTDKDLRKLNRIELLELFLEQCKRNEALEQELSDVKAELDSKNAKISNAGSLAEASLALTNIFEEAQKAADLYLANVRGMTAEDQEEAIRDFLREIRKDEADSPYEEDSRNEADSPYEEDSRDEADSLPKRTEAGLVIEDIDLSDMVEEAAAAKPIDPNKREEDVEAWIRDHQVPEKYRVREEFVEDEYDDDYDEEYDDEDHEDEEYDDEDYDEIIDEAPNDELADEEIAVEEIAYEQNEGVMRPIIPTNEAVTIKVRQAPIRQLSPSRVKRPYSAVGFRKPKPVKPMLSKNVRNAVK